jgi:hypothetical protein
MMATLSELAELRPQLAHVTFIGGWENIRRRGTLMSVSALVSEADMNCGEAHALVSSYRTEIVIVKLPDGTKAVLRDQLRPRDDVAARFDGISEEEWLRLLNDRVFLFPSGHKRIAELVRAYTSKGFAQEELKFKTVELLKGCEDRIEVSTVDAGTSSRTKGASRGRATFVPLAKFPKKMLSRVQEITVLDRVPVTEKGVRSVVRYLASGRAEKMWPRGSS